MFFYSTLFLLIAVILHQSEEVSIDEDLILTYEQKSILDKFKERVSPKVPHDYMKEEKYLIRWLRATNFDVKAAENKLSENLKWREENQMDTIIDEDWTEFEEDYPYFLEGCDRAFRPVSYVPLGQWDIRKAVVQGQRDKLQRYTYKLMEEITVLIRESQKQGANMTQLTILMEMNNFNLVQSVCPSCIPVLLNMLSAFENYYPGYTHKLIFVNTPGIFYTSLNVFRHLMSPAFQKSLVIFGKNKSEWQSWLHTEMSKDQLTKQFGGTKESPWTPAQVRANRDIRDYC